MCFQQQSTPSMMVNDTTDGICALLLNNTAAGASCSCGRQPVTTANYSSERCLLCHFHAALKQAWPAAVACSRRQALPQLQLQP
jgi:hypothetical protein